MKVVICSSSELKLEGVKRALYCKFDSDVEYETISVDVAGLPPQPYADTSSPNSIHLCAEARINSAKKFYKGEYDFIIAIENGICYEKDLRAVDICVCCVENKCGERFSGISLYKFDVTLVIREVEESGKHIYDQRNDKIKGYNKTAGEIIVEHGFAKNSKNWMQETHHTSRVAQVANAVMIAFS